MLPFVSVRRIWSIVRAISSPATGLPATRWDSISLRVRLLATRVQRDEGAAGRADVVAARPDEPVVVVLCDVVVRLAGDARRCDHGREVVYGASARAVTRL